jgi:hypothetical protein
MLPARSAAESLPVFFFLTLLAMATFASMVSSSTASSRITERVARRYFWTALPALRSAMLLRERVAPRAA